MELFGIVLSIPVAFVASVVYCLVLAKVVIRFDKTSRWLWWASVGVLVAFVVEILLLAIVGAVRARGLIGPGFYLAHLALFFLGTPALANVLILRKKSGLLGQWYAAVPLCTALALVLVLLQYGVSEALYGIDGDDGPFSQHLIRLGDKAARQPDIRARPVALAAEAACGLTAAAADERRGRSGVNRNYGERRSRLSGRRWADERRHFERNTSTREGNLREARKPWRTAVRIRSFTKPSQYF